MTLTTTTLLSALFAYLFGGIPIGFLASRVKGVDIRSIGSGNIGATNVGRALGLRWGLCVLLLDALKGFLPTAAFLVIISGFRASSVAQTWLDACWVFVGLCAVIGHVFSPYLGFRGGKGVATSFGVALGFYPELTYPAIASLLVWIVVLLVFRISSTASLAAGLSFPVGYVAICMIREVEVLNRWPFLVYTIAAALILVVRHRANIARLLTGTEARLGAWKKT